MIVNKKPIQTSYAPRICDKCDKWYKPTRKFQKLCVDCGGVLGGNHYKSRILSS